MNDRIIRGNLLLGRMIEVPAVISDDFPFDQWLKFTAYIQVDEKGNVQATGQQAEFIKY